jgi:drug/metabolite transporter (DMT)-like permease
VVAVLLGLVVSMTFGAADFLGGFASRRADPWAVVLGNQVIGLLPAAFFLVVLADQMPTSRDLTLSGTGGLAGVAGLGLLFHGLSIGRMAVVAPVSAGTGSMVPIAWGLLHGERPGALALVGAALTMTAAVILARSEAPVEEESAEIPTSRAALVAVGAGLMFGTALVCFSETSDDIGMWPVVLARLAAIPALAVGLLAVGRGLVVPAPARRPVIGSGVLDASAVVLLLVALRQDLLTVVAPAANLYPAATVMLARIVLHEHLNRAQFVGLALALVGLVLLATG